MIVQQRAINHVLIHDLVVVIRCLSGSSPAASIVLINELPGIVLLDHAEVLRVDKGLDRDGA